MSILLKILGIFGWQRLLGWAWEAVHPSLVELTKKSETKIDDDILAFIDKIMDELVNNGDIEL